VKSFYCIICHGNSITSEAVENRGKKDRRILSRGNNCANRRWCNRFWWILNLIERRHFLPIKVPTRFYRVIISRGHATRTRRVRFSISRQILLATLLVQRFSALKSTDCASIVGTVRRMLRRNHTSGSKKKKRKIERRIAIAKVFERVQHLKMFRQMFLFFYLALIRILIIKAFKKVDLKISYLISI